MLRDRVNTNDNKNIMAILLFLLPHLQYVVRTTYIRLQIINEIFCESRKIFRNKLKKEIWLWLEPLVHAVLLKFLVIKANYIV